MYFQLVGFMVSVYGLVFGKMKPYIVEVWREVQKSRKWDDGFDIIDVLKKEVFYGTSRKQIVSILEALNLKYKKSSISEIK